MRATWDGKQRQDRARANRSAASPKPKAEKKVKEVAPPTGMPAPSDDDDADGMSAADSDDVSGDDDEEKASAAGTEDDDDIPAPLPAKARLVGRADVIPAPKKKVKRKLAGELALFGEPKKPKGAKGGLDEKGTRLLGRRKKDVGAEDDDDFGKEIVDLEGQLKGQSPPNGQKDPDGGLKKKPGVLEKTEAAQKVALTLALEEARKKQRKGGSKFAKLRKLLQGSEKKKKDAGAMRVRMIPTRILGEAPP